MRVGILLVAALATACSRLELDAPSAGPADPAPPPVVSSPRGSVALVAAAGGSGSLRADWIAPPAGLDDVEAALFVAADEDDLLLATPRAIDLADDHARIDGLPFPGEVFVGLGVRAAGASAWSFASPPLRAHLGPVVYVDPTLPPSAGDGTSPATAFGDLALGVLVASAQGGGNVWVATGDVANAAIPLFQGVFVCGGFPADFALGRRAPREGATRLLGVPGQAVTTVEAGPGEVAVLDGVAITAPATAPAGVDLTGRPVELRSVSVDGAERAFKLRALSTGPVVRARIAGIRATGAALQGLSVDGPFDLAIAASDFDGNGTEGLDLDALWAPSGATARLVVTGSRFRSNGNEGADVHLAAPAGATAPGGTFEVVVRDCEFSGNALAGLRVDLEHEAFPDWSSDVLVQSSRARANGGAGVHVDADGRARTVLRGVVASANSGDGVLVSSETQAGFATIADCVLAGNGGAGARATQGNVALASSHCIFTGNVAGAVVSASNASTAHSCASRFDDVPDVSIVLACVATDDADDAAFLHAPRGYATVASIVGPVVSASGAGDAVVGDLVELRDDGVALEVLATSGVALELDPAPAFAGLPARLAWFDAGPGVAEDWRLEPGSFAAGLGWTPPGGAAVDAGVFGSTSPAEPGLGSPLDADPFAIVETAPDWGVAASASAVRRLIVRGGTPDATTVAAAVLARRGGSTLAVTPGVVAGSIEVPAPSGGWRDGDRIEVHRGLRALGGAPIAAPLVIPVRVP